MGRILKGMSITKHELEAKVADTYAHHTPWMLIDALIVDLQNSRKRIEVLAARVDILHDELRAVKALAAALEEAGK